MVSARVRAAWLEYFEHGKTWVNPVLNIALGALVLVIVFVVATGRDTRRQAWSERKRERAKDKAPPRWRRQLSKGSARDTFVVGALLSFPGASYIAGMDLLHKQHIGTAVTVLAVLAFNVIMLMLWSSPCSGMQQDRSGPPPPSSASATGSPAGAVGSP